MKTNAYGIRIGENVMSQKNKILYMVYFDYRFSFFFCKNSIVCFKHCNWLRNEKQLQTDELHTVKCNDGKILSFRKYTENK